MTVHKIIVRKDQKTPWVSPTTPVSDLFEKLEAEDVGALVVSCDGRTIEGIISEHDIVRGLHNEGAAVLALPVSALMTTDVVTCEMTDPIAGIMSLMDYRSIRHVPVVEKGNLAGIVSIQDIIRDRLEEVQLQADSMRSYIVNSV